ncbi:Group-specific protein [Bacillus mobilis]|nr:Group-specific protein [Bacillus mobilis]
MGFEKSNSRKIAAKIGRNFVVDFLIFLFIFVVGFFIMQVLIYRFAKKNIQKYTKIKWVHMWLEMNMKKGPRLDLFDFVVIVFVCIIWKVWMYSLL